MLDGAVAVVQDHAPIHAASKASTAEIDDGVVVRRGKSSAMVLVVLLLLVVVVVRRGRARSDEGRRSAAVGRR